MTRVLVLFLACLAAMGQAVAHEVRPAYLELAETEDGTFDVTWKQPVLDGRRLSLTPVFPGACVERGPRSHDLTGGASVERWRLEACGMREGALRVDGLDRTLTDVFVQIAWRDGETTTALLRPSEPALDLEAPAPPAYAAYLWIGVEHIWFGYDHLLFVIGLVLLTPVRRLFGAVSAFTVAHSLTLGAVVLGGVSLPGRPVEILIAASIVFLAVEVVNVRRGRASLAARRPWILAFAIGLLHGLGFAGALAAIGLPPDQEGLALLLFNLGVEIGQLAFVAVLLGLAWFAARARARVLPPVQAMATYGIGIAGAFWTLERLIG